MHTFGRRFLSKTGNNVALPGRGIVFTEDFHIDFFPENTVQLRAVLPEEKVRNDAAAFSSLHPHDILAVQVFFTRKDLGTFVLLCGRRAGKAGPQTQQSHAFNKFAIQNCHRVSPIFLMLRTTPCCGLYIS